jgi:hypothetical protein
VRFPVAIAVYPDHGEAYDRVFRIPSRMTGAVSDFVPQPIMPLDLPVKVRSWELTVYPRSHIRRRRGVTRPAKARM